MNHLTQYLEEINVAGISLGENYQAYRMDGTEVDRQMRIDAGLGTCSCCDYFILENNLVVLIEETQLTKTITRLKGIYSYLDVADLNQIITDLIKQENQIKVYGSMLVICRLTSKCSNLEDLLRNRRYVFWLVASDNVNSEAHLFYESLVPSILHNLRSQLSSKVVADVKILPSTELPKKITELKATT